MTTNPFRYLCAQCASPWKDGQAVCWNCGSAETKPNPAYAQPVAAPATSLYREPTTKPIRDMSYTRYIVAAVIAGVVVFLAALTAVSILSAAALGVLAAVISWTLSEVTITRKRTENIERMLAERRP
jgi:Flp pilus assembly protein TadB